MPQDRILAAMLLSLTLMWSSAASQLRPLPQPADPHLNDFALLLTNDEEAALREVLGQIAQRGVQTVVVTIPSVLAYDTPHTTIEPFATDLFDLWGVGSAARNDGVMLLLAPEDRAVRIELGRGYGARDDRAMQQLIDEQMLPLLRNDAYGAALLAGARGIERHLAGGALVGIQRTIRNVLIVGVVVTAILGFVLSALFPGVFRRRRYWNDRRFGGGSGGGGGGFGGGKGGGGASGRW